MEDCSQDSFHSYIELGLRVVGGFSDSLVILVQDIPLPARP